MRWTRHWRPGGWSAICDPDPSCVRVDRVRCDPLSCCSSWPLCVLLVVQWSLSGERISAAVKRLPAGRQAAAEQQCSGVQSVQCSTAQYSTVQHAAHTHRHTTHTQTTQHTTHSTPDERCDSACTRPLLLCAVYWRRTRLSQHAAALLSHFHLPPRSAAHSLAALPHCTRWMCWRVEAAVMRC